MRKGLIFGLLIALVALAAIAALLYRPVRVIGTSEKSLAYSVRQEAGSNAKTGCRGEDDDFTCALATGKGPLAYEVSVDDWGCWDAELRKGSAPGDLPAKLSGCITIVDLVRLDD